MSKISKINEKTIMICAVVLFSAAYLSLVWNNNVWMDEAFTASLVHTDFAGVLSRSMADTLPPLYNILLKLSTTVFGYTVPVMKITSVVPMILTLVIGATTVRKRFGIRTAILFMFFITFMPLMLFYGVEIRMYSLGFFFATASGIYAYEIVSDPGLKNWTVFTVFSVLAGYSHHFAFITVAFAYLYLLLYFIFFKREKIRQWFLCLLGTFILYLPCLLVTIKQFARVSGYFSMPDIDGQMFLQYIEYPYVVGVTPATVLCVLIMAAALVTAAVGIIKGDHRDTESFYAVCCFTVYFGVLLFGTAVCLCMSANIFVDRYLFFSVGLLWLFAAVILGRDKRLFIASGIVAIVVGACVYFVEFRTEYGSSADEEIAFLRENVSEGDIFFSIGGHEEMQNCIPFYSILDEGCADLTFVFPLENAVDTALKNDRTLWISVLDGFEPTAEEIEILEKRGLRLEKEADFAFDRYKCGFYKVTR